VEGSCAPALSSTASRHRKVSIAALSRTFIAVSKSAERRARRGVTASVVLCGVGGSLDIARPVMLTVIRPVTDSTLQEP